MPIRERRRGTLADPVELSGRLTPGQRGALVSLERLGWTLSFVRHPLFQAPAVVVSDADHRRYAVLEEDGTLNERHELRLREA